MAAPVLYLVIRLDAERYAIEADLVQEVLPLVRFKPVPGAPSWVAGIMNYRGEAIPVLDLNMVALGAPTASRMMTRIVIVRHECASRPGSRLLGLLVPEVMETSHVDASRFEQTGLEMEGISFLGPVLVTAEGMLQRVSVSSLLSAELRDALLQREMAA